MKVSTPPKVRNHNLNAYVRRVYEGRRVGQVAIEQLSRTRDDT